MFTGIVQGTAKVVSIDDKPNFRTHVVELPAHMLEGLETGASVANNGCCLTVTEINGARISFDLDERDAADYQSWRYSGRR
ncbi:riboflavin synthase eubacterial/eukaryotic [Klebsiella pneumoniae]|nr:riboflavin synthase eubacterial/eukaryotic [Klebsiella pneumoniae]